MDTSSHIIYSVRHETSWKSRSVGETAVSSDNNASRGANLSRRSRKVESLVEFCRAVVSELSQERSARHSEPSQVGTPVFVGNPPKRKIGATAAARSNSRWTFHRPMDFEASGPSDSDKLRSSLHTCRRVEIIAQRSGVELPEAGKTGVAKRRGSHRPLEGANMAPYKKKPKNLGPIWHFSTKAGSCSYRTFVEPGLRPVVHPFSATAIGVTRSRLLAASPCPPVESGWDFMFVSTQTTSREPKSFITCNILCVTSAGTWSWFGTMVKSTKEKTSKFFCSTPHASTFSHSHLMHRNSILSNKFGLMANETCRTAPMKTRSISASISAGPFTGYTTLNSFSSLASNTRSYHGHDLCVSIIS